MSESMVPLSELSAALDEVFRLRRALAYEAEAIAAHLSLRSFPKSRRPIAEQQIERMRSAARGESRPAYGGTASLALRSAMENAGAPETLTRAAFADEQEPR